MTLASPQAPSTVAAARVPNASPGVRHTDAPALRLDQPAFLLQLERDSLISSEARQHALALAAETRLHVLPGLLRLNAIAERPLYRAYAAALDVPLLSEQEIDVSALSSAANEGAHRLGVTREWLHLKGILLFERPDGWCAAFRDEPGPEVQALVARKSQSLGTPFHWLVLPPSLFDAVMRVQQAEVQSLGGRDEIRALRELAEEGPIIELVNSILSQAVVKRASDVHFEPEELEFAVRLRVDGEMIEQLRQPRERFDAVACRLKILASLDIAERRLPQDGRINATVNGENFDIRVSVLPASGGESVVLRLLRQDRKPGRLEDLGMSPAHAQTFERWSRLANGIVLVTGPTGSGKSTTLYTALELANDRSKKIITVEDPVEYKIRGITQLQVNSDIGFTFAGALRSILRHDPDIILLGEIRDEETARIAIQSSLTGHMVLSTLHTNSAIGAVTRLVDMGIEPFLISASVRGLMAQRLVRRLCPHCSVPVAQVEDATRELFARYREQAAGEALALRAAVGCDKCSGTGYLGRFAIYDLIELTSDIASRISTRASEADLIGEEAGEFSSGLLRSGLEHVAQGTTTVSEVLRATGAG